MNFFFTKRTKHGPNLDPNSLVGQISSPPKKNPAHKTFPFPFLIFPTNPAQKSWRSNFPSSPAQQQQCHYRSSPTSPTAPHFTSGLADTRDGSRTQGVGTRGRRTPVWVRVQLPKRTHRSRGSGANIFVGPKPTLEGALFESRV